MHKCAEMQQLCLFGTIVTGVPFVCVYLGDVTYVADVSEALHIPTPHYLKHSIFIII